MKLLVFGWRRFRVLSRPARGGWIEIITQRGGGPWQRSRPARGGWIEILARYHSAGVTCHVPSREGRVD